MPRFVRVSSDEPQRIHGFIMENVFLLLIAVAALGYLAFAVIYPEKF